ncbi:MAG: glutathione S-transferase family protein [Acidobacteria bacterium]|nr:MAG: glutathione S-transferase family protein [Acidobacteriota bacterium]
MSDAARDGGIFLHHYPSSLFSEKVRLALGVRELAWRSVRIAEIMPRPDLMPLTGGYRRTPVLQIGADIYCDTGCILPAIDLLPGGGPSLFPYGGREWPIARWADTAFFQSAVGVVFGRIDPAALPPGFVADREKLSGRPFDLDALRAALPHSAAQLRGAAAWVERSASAGPRSGFLLGDRVSAADLAVYMVFWFVEHLAPDALSGIAGPATRAWMQRVALIGHGSPHTATAQEALEAAAQGSPAAGPGEVLDAGLAVGELVAVTPDDYGRVPVVGELLVADRERIVVRRHDSRVGEVAVHFPRVGFHLAAAPPEMSDHDETPGAGDDASDAAAGEASR